MKRTNNLLPVLLSFGLVTVCTAFYGTFVTYWLEEGFQETSYFKITLIVAIPLIITMVGVNFWGVISDHFQKRRSLVSMAAMAAALQYLTLTKFVTSVTSFLLVVSFFSLFYSAMHAAAPALVTLLLKEKGQASGLLIMTGSLGWFFGGILGGALYPILGMRWLMMLAVFLCTTAGVVVFFSDDPKEMIRSSNGSIKTRSWSNVLKIRQISIVVVTMLILYTGTHIFLGLSTNYLIKIAGLSTFQVGMGTAFATLTGAILSKALGDYMEHHGRRNVFLFGILIYPFTYLALFLARNPWIITALWCLPYYVGTYTSGLTITADVTTPTERAKAAGVFFASLSLAQGLGSVIGGFVANHLGLRVLVLLPILPGIGAFLVAYFMLNESVPQKP